MCGIVGIVGSPLPEGVRSQAGLIERMTAQLRHRGPDASGVWSDDHARIGHARLSIVDLSAAGNQPMHAGPLVLTYNGEIYNFKQLRRTLPGPFVSETDSEVVLHAYRELGPACVEQFSGMFAFAIWDRETRQLFAARDHLGIKPLFYRPLDDGIAFASELAPLLELGPGALGRPPIDRSALVDYLTYGYVPTPKTAWQGIFKLPAAHTLEWRDGRLTLRRYWQPRPSEEITDLGEAAAQAEELLARAVADHFMADVPVGIFLSSGLDSASVTAFSPSAPLTFTMGQKEAHRDEAGPARALAEHLSATSGKSDSGSAEHREFVAAVPDLGEAIDEMVSVFDEPFGDSAALSVWLLSRFTARHVKVALSGEGGDEIFCGYRWYGSAMTRPPGLAAPLMARLAPKLSRLGRSQQRRAATGLERYAAFLSVFAPRQVGALLGPWLGAATGQGEPGDEDRLWHFRRYWRPELPLHQRLQWADVHTYLPDDLLAKVDRASMAFSLEVRPPLLDRRLVDLAFRFHRSLQRDPATDRGKRVLRQVIEPRLPPGHLDLPKRGFNLPIARWIRREGALWQEAVGRLAAAGVIRRPRIFNLTNEQTWALLILDRWLLRNEPGY